MSTIVKLLHTESWLGRNGMDLTEPMVRGLGEEDPPVPTASKCLRWKIEIL
jgi:hypothetical protein